MKKTLFIVVILGILLSQSHAQTFRVINMIPNALSNEANQDSEPHITVNPNDPTQIIASAFTPNPTGATATAPIYISQNGGNTWVLNNNVPSLNGSTGDITVGLSRNNVLYTGILTGGYIATDRPQMQILRSNNYLNPGTMPNLLTRTREDQPYVETITPLGGAERNNDHVYVGHNDFNAGTQTATIEQSLNAATAPAPANLTTERLEVRATGGQDGPPIRTSAHPDGTVYAIFDRITNIPSFIRPITMTSDIIVVRDDNWGQGATSYNDLVDPSDGLAGRILAPNITWTFDERITTFGQARIGDRMSIAVDPRNSQTVYTVHTDRNPAGGVNSTRIHVRRSIDGGANWSADLLTVNNAIIPQIAVNIRGEIGLLYQVLAGGNWTTRYRQSSNGGTTWSNTILHQAPSNTPIATFAPYLGDYAGLKAVGKDFYGIFSGNNTPNNANFPQNVTYQRNANFVTNVLRNQTNTANVNVSIDPFFFEVQQIPDDEDFYVRDWTDSSTDADTGLEPSTHPVFYRNSDVWNRRSNATGTFTSLDRPQSEDPQIATLGNNFAFARVHRNGGGSNGNVNLHFLKAEFGTGSNYVNAGTNPDPPLTFSTTDQNQTLTAGYEWTLNATSSTHTCLAVEISTTSDPVVTPSLLGRAPGWPDTDLSVLYDNNKAQRNMGVFTTPPPPPPPGGVGGSITYYAVVHNAATYVRDMTLDFTASKTFDHFLGRPQLSFPVDFGENVRVKKNRINFYKMEPGENRWVGITIPADKLSNQNSVTIDFTEIENNIPINGFSVEIKQGSVRASSLENHNLNAANFLRIAKLFDQPWAAKVSDEVIRQLVRREADQQEYRGFLKENFDAYSNIFNIENLQEYFSKDIFEIKKSIELLGNSINENGAANHHVIVAHAQLNQKIDAMLTYVDKQSGDVADIMQNIRWQEDILMNKKKFAGLNSTSAILKKSRSFRKGFQMRKLTNSDYVKYLQENIEDYVELGSFVKEKFRLDVSREIKVMSNVSRNAQKLQKAHYNLLSKIYHSSVQFE